MIKPDCAPTPQKFDDLDDREKLQVHLICTVLLKARKEGLFEAEVSGHYLNKTILQVLKNELQVEVKVWLGNGNAILSWK